MVIENQNIVYCTMGCLFQYDRTTTIYFIMPLKLWYTIDAVVFVAGRPLSFETGGTMGYNCCFFINFVPLHIESPYNFGGTGPILGVTNPLQRVNGHAVVANIMRNIHVPNKFKVLWRDCKQYMIYFFNCNTVFRVV